MHVAPLCQLLLDHRLLVLRLRLHLRGKTVILGIGIAPGRIATLVTTAWLTRLGSCGGLGADTRKVRQSPDERF